MKPKKLYIKTMGCQMNVYDSEAMARVLAPMGYELTAHKKDADCLLLNTCAIRAKAEQKVFSYLGRLTGLKGNNPDLLIGVGGCVAQQEAKKIFDRAPHVDFVFGPHAINRLPEIVAQAEQGKRHVAATEFLDFFEEIKQPHLDKAGPEESGVSAFVTIMSGCDNYCTYCVVPHVRGREMSRDSQAILAEVENLAAKGVKEITLLGQNVNSYGNKEGFGSFAGLLRLVHEAEGVERIRFTTSHPKDLSQELIQAFAELPKLCKHIHLPVQSGSNRILKKMNRGYTREDYLGKVRALREACPEIRLTTDIIAGFPSETEEDFQDTMDLIRRADYDSLFAFMYSDRPSAPAVKFPDKLSEEVKSRRLTQVLKVSEEITRAKHAAMVGSKQQVLVEGRSVQNPEQWRGRTGGHVTVNFLAPASGDLVGKQVDVLIENGYSNSLSGKLWTEDGDCPKPPTEESHAA
ncbi:tRNA (N6-isopentenyl adenosine(37)-C2)-methylthiotransferase MiaB [Desulfatibacillum aliphaticivorans]|uniref:tRNA (N6-isopentenyl adenosine(37)-C2)-methylthiotransferase MiaB n=1 Tax=Desulfatibacillum aliphaticivorans TaxID=218208 RepID=UPI00042522BE|nr:tRNA (N6-isopentenyl adenosine(37)-C2)-methylthiotransferase MiaB [Desulfatibacillum aliphaticivorans]